MCSDGYAVETVGGIVCGRCGELWRPQFDTSPVSSSSSTSSTPPSDDRLPRGRIDDALRRAADAMELPDAIVQCAREMLASRAVCNGRSSVVLATSSIYCAAKLLKMPRLLSDALGWCPELALQRGAVLRCIRAIGTSLKGTVPYVPKPSDYVSVLCHRLSLNPALRRGVLRAAAAASGCSRSPIMIAAAVVATEAGVSAGEVARAAGVSELGVVKAMQSLKKGR